VLTFIFFNLTFFPMHILGMGGHMRRIYDPTQYEFLAQWQNWNVFITQMALCLGATQALFAINFIVSIFAGKRAGRNPWNANTLEWSASSPAPHGNWGEKTPTVYRGPYEYSVPGMSDDYLPQDRPGEAVPVPPRPDILSPAQA